MPAATPWPFAGTIPFIAYDACATRLYARLARPTTQSPASHLLCRAFASNTLESAIRDATTGEPMPGYTTRMLTVRLGGQDFRIRALSDLQQFADPTRRAHRAGISSSLWSLFGQVWPSGRVLAEAMSTFDIAGKRILELGCGLGLSSLVLAHRRADVVASDHHPLAESFLAYNAGLNDLPAVTYRDLPWAIPDATLGSVDLIIGSDILYERDHAAQIAAMMLRHAGPDA